MAISPLNAPNHLLPANPKALTVAVCACGSWRGDGVEDERDTFPGSCTAGMKGGERERRRGEQSESAFTPWGSGSATVALQVEHRAHRDPHGSRAPTDVDGSYLATLFSLTASLARCTSSAARGKTVT